MSEHVIYAGTRHDSNADINVSRNGHTFWANRSIRCNNHSPDGFNWGYGGSGPAQLALALLLDVTDDEELAEQHHQEFKRDVVAGFDDSWTYTARQIREWLERRTTNEHSTRTSSDPAASSS